MIFKEIYYAEYQEIINNTATVYLNKQKNNKNDSPFAGIILYEINAIGNYNIVNNELIIDDLFLNKTKTKLKKKYKDDRTKDLMNSLKEEFIIDLGESYMILTQEEDRNPEDVKLTPDEFLIKRLIE